MWSFEKAFDSLMVCIQERTLQLSQQRSAVGAALLVLSEEAHCMRETGIKIQRYRIKNQTSVE